MGRFYSDGDDLSEEEREEWKRELDQMIREPKGQEFLRWIKRGMEALPERKLINDGFYHRIEIDLRDNAETDPPVKEEACALGAALRLKVLKDGVALKWVDSRSGFRSEFRSLEDLSEASYDNDEEGYEHANWAAHTFGVPDELTWHIGWLNDEKWEEQSPGERYRLMMLWIDKHLQPEPVAA